MKQQSDSKKRIAFPIQLFSDAGAGVAIPDEIHIVPTGKWDHPVYGEMEITSADVSQFVTNFKAGVRRDIPITAGHDNGMSGGELPAIGWFKELIDRGVNGLWAFVEWTAEGKGLLSDGAFKYFSPEFYETYADPETGEKYDNVLVGGALTNKPYFKELSPVVAFSEPSIMKQFNSQTMNLNDIVAKKPEDLSADEKAFLVEHKGELTDEQKATFESVIPAEGGQGEGGEGAGDGAGNGDGNDEGGAGDGVQASEKGKKGKQILMSEAEAAALREMANKGAKAFAEVEKMKLAAEVDKLVFSESNKDGRVLPKQKDAVVTLMLSLSEKQRDQFRNIVNNLPKAVLSFDEIGDGGAQGGTDVTGVAKEVEDAVQGAIKASEGKLTYSAALAKVYSEKPDLKKRYEEALSAGSN
ncbi:MAG: hypothetical protein BGO51_15550 [Rhodospirillales bacterium 69-11]|nr:MAG: hypothetical protein BGO51_15550 [Rhodospirillales bacterium 69-11]